MDALDFIDPELSKLIRPRRFSPAAQGGSNFISPDQPEFTTEDERTVLGNLRDGAVNTFGAVGNFLDVPGSMVRDTLAGENPFDQALPWNWFSSQGRTTGHDLARQWGMADKRQSLGNMAGGIGLEVALDPLTYLTFGGAALTKAGTVASKSGLLDDVMKVAANRTGKAVGEVGKREARMTTTLDELLQARPELTEAASNAAKKSGTTLDAIRGEKLGGAFNAGIPFTAGKTFGDGPWAQAYARGLDKVGKAIRYGNIPGTNFSPVNAAARTLSSQIGDTATPFGQEVAKQNFRAKQAAGARSQLDVNKMTNMLDDLEKGGLAKELEDSGYLAAHGMTPKDTENHFRRLIRYLVEDKEGKYPVPEPLRPIIDELKDTEANRLQVAAEWGMPLNKLVDPEVDYFGRYMTKGADFAKARDGKLLTTYDAGRLKRRNFLRDIPRGTVGIEDIASDPQLNKLIDDGATHSEIKDYLEATHGSWLSDKYRVFNKDKGKYVTYKGRYSRLAKWLPSVPKEVRETGVFGNHPLLDFQGRDISFLDAHTGFKSLRDALAQPTILKDAPASAADMQNYTTVNSFLKGMGVKGGTEDMGFLNKLREVVDPTGTMKVEELGRKVISKEHAKDLSSLMKVITAPEAVGQIVKFTDSVLNLSKGAWTTLWPAFHVRNLFSGQVHNAMLGMWDKKSVVQANELRQGRVIKGSKDWKVVQDEYKRRYGSTAVTKPEQANTTTDISGDITRQSREKRGKTMTDGYGRTWSYDDGEGVWSHGEHVIGVAAKSGKRWSVWDGPSANNHDEFKTLREAMDSIYDGNRGDPASPNINQAVSESSPYAKELEAKITKQSEDVNKAAAPEPESHLEHLAKKELKSLLTMPNTDETKAKMLSDWRRSFEPHLDVSAIESKSPDMQKWLSEKPVGPTSKRAASEFGNPNLDIDKIRQLQDPEVFSKLSPNHSKINQHLDKLVAEKGLSEVDAKLLRVITGQMSLDNVPNMVFAPLNIDGNPAIRGQAGVRLKPGASVDSATGELFASTTDPLRSKLSMQKHGPTSATTFLHELFHILQDEIIWNKDHPLMPVVQEFEQLVKDNHADLQKHFERVHGYQANYYMSTPYPHQFNGQPRHVEAFVQFAAESMINRKTPKGLLGEILTKVQTYLMRIFENFIGKGALDPAVEKRMHEIVDIIAGVDRAPDIDTAVKVAQGQAPMPKQPAIPKQPPGATPASPPPAGVPPAGKPPGGSPPIPPVGGPTAPLTPAPVLDDALATRILGEMMAAHGVVGKFEGNAQSVTGRAAGLTSGNLDDLINAIPQPGRKSLDWKRVGKKFVGAEPGTDWKPWHARGVGDQIESSFGPMAAGEEIGFSVEFMNRAPAWLKLIQEGYSPAAAAQKVGAAQILYGNKNFSPFETQVLSRIFPFYKFSSRMFHQIMKQLMERPGRGYANVVRATNRMQNPDEFAPDYVRDTASIPMTEGMQSIFGKPPEGTDRYITGFGLMHEDPFSFGPGIRNTLLEAASRMNPLIKGPLEYATGQTFFQRGPEGGRPLGDLDPTIGRILSDIQSGPGEKNPPVQYPGDDLIEFIAGNSPLARALTTVRSLTDTRKRAEYGGPGPAAIVNALTGVRISDVSPAAKEAMVRDLLKSEMKDTGAKEFVRTYYRKEDLEQMSPEAKVEAQRLQALLNVLAKRAKERKKAEEGDKKQLQAVR